MKYVAGFYGACGLSIIAYGLLFGSFFAIAFGLFLVIVIAFCSIFLFCADAPRLFLKWDDTFDGDDWPHRSY